MLSLSRDDFVDFQLHTTYSDGDWTPEALLDYLKNEGFALAAITDHERVDTAAAIQELAAQKHMPILRAVEMTASWRGGMTDTLCFGFDPEKGALHTLARDVWRRQYEVTKNVFAYLCDGGYILTDQSGMERGETLSKILDKPASRQPHDLFDLLKRDSPDVVKNSFWEVVKASGFAYMSCPIADIVEAAHHDGAVCLIAHPGRAGGYVTYDAERLEQIRQDVPIDGLEVYYPLHSPGQVALYEEFAQRYDLLMSAGSDSHSSTGRLPIKYRAELVQRLLERLGVRVE